MSPRLRRPALIAGVVLLALLGGPLLVPQPDTGSSSGPELAGPEGRFARLNGVDVHYEATGPDGAPAMVLLHHFYGSTRSWRHLLDGLDGWRTIAFDRPGFGLSERPPRSAWTHGNPYTRRAAADIAFGLLDEQGAGPSVLVGASAGGTVALEAYAAAPARVRALVLVSPAITGDVGPPAALRPLLRTPQARRLGPYLVRRRAADVSLERVTRSWHDPARATAEDLDAYRRPLRVEGWDRGFWEVVTAESPPRLAGLLPRIDVPTLVVTGDADTVVAPRLSRRTAQAIPGARFEVIEDCGHVPHEECPKALLEIVEAFLAEL